MRYAARSKHFSSEWVGHLTHMSTNLAKACVTYIFPLSTKNDSFAIDRDDSGWAKYKFSCAKISWPQSWELVLRQFVIGSVKGWKQREQVKTTHGICRGAGVSVNFRAAGMSTTTLARSSEMASTRLSLASMSSGVSGDWHRTVFCSERVSPMILKI